MAQPQAVWIRSAAALCALGDALPSAVAAWRLGRSGVRPEQGRLVGRIANRQALAGRRYGAASNLALSVAREALGKVGWSRDELVDAAVFAGSSRGNLLEVHGRAEFRRPFGRLAASNELHSEIAAAVSIELGFGGPWQLQSSGCSAGLDALGMAWLALRAGVVKRAMVVAVDLPLLPELMQSFARSSLLGSGRINDPLSAQTDGIHLGEGAAALALEVGGHGRVEVLDYRANSDAHDSLMIPKDGEGLQRLLAALPRPALLCPHATGTPNHALAEMSALRARWGAALPPMLLLKPFTGHTLGASGLLDVALMVEGLPQLPGNLPGLSAVPAQLPRLGVGDEILKLASAMGGHNAALRLRLGEGSHG